MPELADEPPVLDREVEGDLLSASIPVGNVKALYLEYLGRAVPMTQRLKRQPWGAEDFIVQDPDGNLIHSRSPFKSVHLRKNKLPRVADNLSASRGPLRQDVVAPWPWDNRRYASRWTFRPCLGHWPVP